MLWQPRASTTPQRSPRGKVWFWSMCLFVGAVSAYDGWLLVRNQEVILAVEENPLCRWLIELDQGNVGLLLQFKAAGTAAVVLALKVIHVFSARWSVLITIAIALFQAGLLAYLMIG